MKWLYIFLLLLVSKIASGQNSEANKVVYQKYFKELEIATKRYFKLWDKDLYSSILLVDPQTRQIFSNESDPLGTLKENKYGFPIIKTNQNEINTCLHLYLE